MSLQRSLVAFCIDISPSMGAQRSVKEQVLTSEPEPRAGAAQQESAANGGLAHAMVAHEQQDAAGLSSSKGDGTPNARERTRRTTDLEWAMEFVAKKVRNSILSGLKTAKVYVQLFGSKRTQADIIESLSEEVRNSDDKGGFNGIDEIFLPSQPTMATLELVRCLRASQPDEDPYPADPISAVYAAIYSLNNKPSGGETNKWNRTIYLITDGRTSFECPPSDIDVLKNRLQADNINLKVVGIDFDDEESGLKEEDKDEVKAHNEQWWRDLVEDLPGSAVASAAVAVAQSSLPSIQLKNSAPFSARLTFGNPDRLIESTEVMDIAVKMYKATAIERPLSQRKLSKIAQDSAAARQVSTRMQFESSQMRPSSTPNYPYKRKREEGEEEHADNDLTYGTILQRKYFIKEDLENVEGGINAAEPFPEGAEATFDRAYKLGATLVALNDDLERKQDTKAGIEVIQFTRKELYKRHYHMSETWFMFASNTSVKAQVQLSSLIQAMWKQEKYAIVRFVRRDGTEPKIGILAPQVIDEEAGIDFECFYFVEAPFREDLKRFAFPPLDRVINREGEELNEHSSLPSKDMQSCMDDLVDSMDLMEADSENEIDGQPGPWFACEDSYNPAIHNIQEAVTWRAFHPDDRSLPKPNIDVMKFLSPPEVIIERSSSIAEKCRTLFDLQYVPTLTSKGRSARRRNGQMGEAESDEAQDQGEVKELDLGGVMDEELAEEAARSGAEANEVSEAQDGDTGGDQHGQSEQGTLSTSDGGKVNLDIEDPLADFETKLGNDEEAVEDVMDAMSRLIRKMVFTSFGSNDYGQARDLLLALRKGAIDYEEAKRYNAFLRELKSSTLAATSAKGQRSRSDFWNLFVRGRDDLSLIRDDEALGERLQVDSETAAEFINL